MFHSLAMTAFGEIFGWGYNKDNVLELHSTLPTKFQTRKVMRPLPIRHKMSFDLTRDEVGLTAGL